MNHFKITIVYDMESIVLMSKVVHGNFLKSVLQDRI